MYLGDGCLSESKRDVWRLRITLDASYPGIVATERKGAYVRRAPRYAFKNRSEDILELFRTGCELAGVHCTRPSPTQIAVYSKAAVARLDEFVGPKR